MLTVFFFSCKEEEVNIPIILDGTYKGTFQRRTLNGGLSSQITINFNSNTWNGESEYPKYPALCNGAFTIRGNTIEFTNLCHWTAEFDWSLVLAQQYQIRKIGGSIEISRDYGGSFKDVYILTKQ